MSENEYKELVNFLGKQFENIHDQFENINERLDSTASKDDIIELRREMGVLYEDVQHKFDIVAEGMTAIREGFKKDAEENEQEHAQLDKRTLINAADISSLGQRVVRLEGKSSPL